jgi:transketolase
VAKGAYVLADGKGAKPEIILMATGTEVGLAVDAYEKLSAEGVKARAVSMPSWELFEQQPESYRESVLPHDVKARMSVEQAGFLAGLTTPGWERRVSVCALSARRRL